MINKDLEQWLIDNYLDFKSIDDDVFEIIGVGKFFIYDSGESPLFTEEFDLNLIEIDTDRDELLDEGIQYSAYKFGNIWYYTSNESEVAEMNPLQTLGEAFLEIDDQYTNLGVHGFRELLNGSGQYESWAKQAKFFGHKALGICDKNSLSGCLLFQNACKKYGIKPILGITIDIKYGASTHEAKLYAKDSTGWKNILNISNIINNDNHAVKNIDFDELYKYSDGIVFVFSKSWIPDDLLLEEVTGDFGYGNVFYQLDTTEYSSDAIDKHYLDFTKQYIDSYGLDSNKLKPILISDSYYVHRTDYQVKKILNQIGTGASHLQSSEQFFRPIEYHYDKLDPLIKEEQFNEFDDMIYRAVENTMLVSVECDFEINTDFLNMPEYELTEEESKKYKDKYELFDAIVDANWNDRVPEGMDDEYQDRLDEEFRVIDGNGFLDYFLINWDWLQFCKRENIYTGIARGSAGGSVLSYLLGVTNIDPIKYDLLFERFLNEGRLKKTVKTKYLKFTGQFGSHQYEENKLLKVGDKYLNAREISVGDIISGTRVKEIEEFVEEIVTAGSPPDIDSDIESTGRQRVKEYLEERYGKNRVFSIGTYTGLGIKSALSDVARQKGVESKLVKKITKMIMSKEVLAGFGYIDLFKKAMNNEGMREFIHKYPEVIELTRVVLDNSKSQSVHAAGVIITPKYDRHGNEMNAWDWTPTKFYDDQLVSEWEGSYLEQSGMLKLDLLGLNTLDKIHYVVDSVEKETGEKIDWHDIYTNRLDDKPTFDIFKKGFTQNVFQFSGEKMTRFVQSMEPTCVNDIFAANALFRPATMNLGYHEDYVEMKHGRKEIEYDWGMEEITKDTYSIIAYQEQSMQVVQKIGNFSLQEADDVRKAMGKKKKDLMDSYKGKFVQGAVSNGCDEFDAIKIWNDIEQGASYSFNRSHAAAYGLESYVTAYLKAHYPIHFYTMSLAMSNDDDRPNILSEINDDGRITIQPPHINQSGFSFETDFAENKIYWSIKSIKMVGDVAVRNIVRIREEGGDYVDLKDFVERTAGHKVNKQHIANLIASGAFDEIENLSSPIGRYGLLKWVYEEHFGEKTGVPDRFRNESNTEPFFWNMLQNELSGIGNVDYKNIFTKSKLFSKMKIQYLNPEDFDLESKVDKFIGFAGTIIDIQEMTAKVSGNLFAKIVVQCNNRVCNFMVWFKQWEEYGSQLLRSKGKIIIFNAKVSPDEYNGGNQLYSHNKTKIEIV